MSVIDFISVRKKNADGFNLQPGAAANQGPQPARSAPPPLTSSQFARHLAQIAEDETRRALKKHVETIDPREMIDLAKMVAEIKAKYVGTTLAFAGNRTPVTDAETEQLRGMRLRLQELEAAYAEVTEVVSGQLVDVRGVTRE